MPVLNELKTVFREVFDNDALELTPEMTADDVDGWDSFSHVILIVAIETKFRIKFQQKELMSFKTVGDLSDSVRRKITG